MEIDIHYEVIEYSNEGYGRLPNEFPTLSSAIAWVDEAQEKADQCGNPRDLCYEVVPAGSCVHRTVSRVKSLNAAA